MKRLINFFLIFVLISSILFISGCNETKTDIQPDNTSNIQEEIPLSGNIVETGSVTDNQQTTQEIPKNTTTSPVTTSSTAPAPTTTSTTSTTKTDPCISLGCPEGTKYVGSSGSNKYHYCSCTYAKKIYPENLLCFKSKDDAISQGYVPCGSCKP